MVDDAEVVDETEETADAESEEVVEEVEESFVETSLVEDSVVEGADAFSDAAAEDVVDMVTEAALVEAAVPVETVEFEAAVALTDAAVLAGDVKFAETEEVEFAAKEMAAEPEVAAACAPGKIVEVEMIVTVEAAAPTLTLVSVE